MRFLDEESKNEIEEESNPNTNNGMPLVKKYESLLEGGRKSPFFLL